MTSLSRDVVSSIRSLWRSRGFAAVAILTVALAAGVTGSVFGVVDTLVLRSLPYPDVDRLIVARSGSQDRDDFPLSSAEYLDYRFDSKSIEASGACQLRGVTVELAPGNTDVALAAYMTPGLPTLLGLEVARGRTFTEDEGREGGPAVAFVSNQFWNTRLQSDPSFLADRTIAVSGTATRIVGVLGEGETLPGSSPSIYLPLQLPSVPQTENRSGHDLTVFARLRQDTTIESAREEAARLTSEWQRRYEGGHVLKPDVHPFKLRPFRDYMLGGAWSSINLLFWAALAVTILACANLSTLMIARAEARKNELGIRSALGAGFLQLARLTLIESTALAVIGGGIGIGISAAVLKWVGSQQAGSLRVGANSLASATLDIRLAVVTVVVAALSGMLFGMLPAWMTTRLDLTEVLTSSAARSGSSRKLRRTFNALVFVQLALAAVLLNATAMLMSGVLALSRVDLGFNSANRIAFSVRLEPTTYDEPRILAFYENARRTIAAIPGVESVAAARTIPLRGSLGTEGFIYEGEAWHEGDPTQQVYFQMVSPSYFETMEIPLLRGRAVTEDDRLGTPAVAMLNRAGAEAYFGSVESAIGRRIIPLFMGGPDAEPTTIVGVSENVRHFGPAREVKPEIMLPIAQSRGWTFEILRGADLVVHASPGAEDSVMAAIRARLSESDPGVPLIGVEGLETTVQESTARERFLAKLTTGFGVLALLIASVGVLGVVLFGVNAGRRELGVRMALGQTQLSLVAHVLSRGLRVAVAAAVAGIVLTFASARIVTAAIQGSGYPGPLLVALSTATLLATVTLACLGPAIRAARLDPTKVLGAE